MSDLWRTARDRRIVAAIVFSVLVFVFVVPYMLLLIGGLRKGDWQHFSNVAGAYGGVASVFGMLTLVGVIASLALQVRDSRANLELIHRSLHTELLNAAMDDPALRACWGPTSLGSDVEARQHIYITKIVTFWSSAFTMGKMSEDELRGNFSELVRGEPGRRYWRATQGLWEARMNSGNDVRFVEILMGVAAGGRSNPIGGNQ
ncbi:hypothetical protein G5C51_20785 [Streptomyces sp. A7024]|uniref:Uncharacterized protein n=1 Tax=Streptomyces coryli TaxID=1128680 RepID=A0A6G4U2D7_9ACTN|nr:DUF6082 family protein [Streptomyces coryli]NGN66324.1 hypothetical protein [Streptomyces coryli]